MPHSNIDVTPAGLQTVLPGAEQLEQSELAKLRAARPMQPKAPQKACDVGLFGDEQNQQELFR